MHPALRLLLARKFVGLVRRQRRRLRKPAGWLTALFLGEMLTATAMRAFEAEISRAVVLALFVFGGAALKPFAFVLTVGVIVGTYSSIFIAAPFLVIWTEFLAKRRSASATKNSTSDSMSRRSVMPTCSWRGMPPRSCGSRYWSGFARIEIGRWPTIRRGRPQSGSDPGSSWKRGAVIRGPGGVRPWKGQTAVSSIGV